MAYRPRYTILEDGATWHVTWQCHNHDWLLAEEWAKELYYNLLLKYKDQYGIRIHSYHLMENHIHLTGTLTELKAFSEFFRTVNNLFARGHNKEKGQSGQVCMDRFKSPRIKDDEHLLRAMTYGDMNGVRCKRDKHPGDAKWSSYAYYAHGKADPLITSAPSYLNLGKTDKARQRAYREMVAGLVKQEKINVSNVCFIGDPEWVTGQYAKLQTELKNLRIIRELRRRPPMTASPP